MDALTYSVQVNDPDTGIYTIRLHGELDLVGAQGLKAVLAKLAYRWLILDLERLTFVDSSGLNFFLGLQVECETSMRRLSLLNVPESTRKVMDLLGITDLFDLN